MIQQTKFLGISLRTMGHRRALVVVYYVCLLGFVAVPLARHKFMPGILFAQTFSLGSFFGGIRAAGVVKPYSKSTPPLDPGSLDPISLNLSGRTPLFSQSRLLDEREKAARDHAHFVAYRILIFSLAILFLAVFLTLNWTLSFFEQNAGTLLWLLTVYVLSLPQSVILWTEPEPMAEGGLELVPSRL